MLSKNYSNRLFGRTRGRSKKKIDLKKYHQMVTKYQFDNCNDKINYILDIGSGYGETSIFLANQFLDKVIIISKLNDKKNTNYNFNDADVLWVSNSPGQNE